VPLAPDGETSLATWKDFRARWPKCSGTAQSETVCTWRSTAPAELVMCYSTCAAGPGGERFPALGSTPCTSWSRRVATRLKTNAPREHPAFAAMAKEAPLVRWAGPPGVLEFLSEMRRAAPSEPDAEPQGLARRTHARSASPRSSSGRCASSIAEDRRVQMRGAIERLRARPLALTQLTAEDLPESAAGKASVRGQAGVEEDAEDPPDADASVALPHGQARGEEDQPQSVRPPIVDVPEGFVAIPAWLDGTSRHYFWHLDSNLTDWDMTKLQSRIALAQQERRVKAGLANKAAERRAREELERKATEEADKQDRLAMFSVYRKGLEYLVSAPIFVKRVFRPQEQAFCFEVLPGQKEVQELLCACGLDNAACGACGRGWAQQEQARLGFFEVPSLGTASAMWVRGGTEGYPNSVSKWYFLHRSVEAPCPMVGKCTFLAPLSERKKLVDMLPEAALQSRIWDKPEVPVQVVADVLAGLAKGKGPRAMYACPKCELSFFKWQVCLNHCRGSPCTGPLRERLCPLRDDFADNTALQEACRQAAAQ